jgi:hypothetical protein
MLLTIAAILAFVAGQPRFGYLSERTGQFVGLALILLAGLAWAVMRIRAGRGICCCRKPDDADGA